MYYRFLVLFIGSFFSFQAFAFNVNEVSSKGLKQLYGFLVGQSAAIELGKKAAPELAHQYRLAQLKFDANFPGVQKKLEAILKEELTEDQWIELQRVARESLRTQLDGLNVTPEVAGVFLKELQGRADGVISSPMLQYLLAVQFEKSPVSEFLQGYRQNYVGDGKGKAKGLFFNLQIPLSWKAKDGDRPNIVQSWTSANGTGLESMSAMVKIVPNDITKDDILETIKTPEGQKTLVPERTKIIKAQAITIETYPGYHIEYEIPTERVGDTYYSAASTYAVFTKTHMFVLNCMAGSNNMSHARASFKTLRPLCQQVASSIVLPQRYAP